MQLCLNQQLTGSHGNVVYTTSFSSSSYLMGWKCLVQRYQLPSRRHPPLRHFLSRPLRAQPCSSPGRCLADARYIWGTGWNLAWAHIAIRMK